MHMGKMNGVLMFLLIFAAAAALAAEDGQLAPIAYTASGGIAVPQYDKWVFIGSGAFDTPETAPAPRFSNVFVDPAAYDIFARTGTWPNRTIIFSEKRAGRTTVPITKNPGWGQTGDPLGFEFEVKDQSKGGWRYYTAGPGDKVGVAVANQSDCTTCHAEHGAVDNTFVQFYPKLAAIARQHGTLRQPTQ